MRIAHALSLLLAVIAVVLIAGCSGGGGGTPQDTSNGVITNNTTLQQITYTPPATRQAYSVYAYFTNVMDSAQMVSATFHYDTGSGKWTLDYSPTSTQFNGNASGNYNMQVWVIFSDNSEQTLQVGSPVLIENLSVSNSGGPPPPPWQ